MTSNSHGFEVLTAFRLIRILVKEEGLSVPTTMVMLRVNDSQSVMLEKLSILENLVTRKLCKDALSEIVAAVRNPIISVRLMAVRSLGECGASI